MRVMISLLLVSLMGSAIRANDTADQRYLYRFRTADDQRATLSVEKYALADGKAVWQRDLPGISSTSYFDFIGEQDGNVALYSARRAGEGITDPAEVVLLNAEDGALRARYWCSLDDAVPERLPRWTSGPTDTRALLHADGQLLAGTYGQGLWRTDDGASWRRVTDARVPAHLVSLGAGRHGAIVAGTWMGDGLVFRSSLDPAFRLLAWPNQPRWPGWWNRDYSRCLATGFSGETLYARTDGGFLRWTPGAGWERAAIPAGDAAVINDSGIWTASADGAAVRMRHYTPAGRSDLDVPIPVPTRHIHAMTTLHGALYLLTADGRIISCTAADVRAYATALAKGRRMAWAPFTRSLLGQDRTVRAGHALFIHAEQGYRPVIIAGTSQGPIFTDALASATLDPSLAAYDQAFAAWRDATGEWLAMGGKEGVVMLPASVIRASLFAENQQTPGRRPAHGSGPPSSVGAVDVTAPARHTIDGVRAMNPLLREARAILRQTNPDISRITSLTADKITIAERGETYGDVPRSYDFTWDPYGDP